MSPSHTQKPSSFTPLRHRLLRSTPARIVAGALATVAPVALLMGIVQHLFDKPYRQTWPQLLAVALCLFAYRAFVHVTEGRQPPELAPKPALREAVAGMLLSAVLVCIVCAALAAAGVLQIVGAGGGNLIGPLAEMALAATLEEVLFRAVLFRLLAAWLGVQSAFVLSSLLFALAHLPNDGFSLLAFGALVAAGMLLVAAYLVHDRLWLPIGLHFGWNYAIAGVFGLSSSGQTAHGYLQTRLSGPAWLSGGSFGVEASVVTLVVLAVAAALLLALGRRRRQSEASSLAPRAV